MSFPSEQSRARSRAIAGVLFVSLAFLSVTSTAFAAPHDGTARPPFHVRGGWTAETPVVVPAAVSPQGLSPTQIRAVYNLPSSGGTGTIALIEAYDNANAESDLGTFDTAFSLALCTTGNGCFEKHKMATSISSNSGWTLESDLDVQWAHAIAPSAKILLVEAKSASIANLLAAVDYARGRSDVVAISMSWGSAEFSSEASSDSHFVSAYGASFFASSGDSGSGVEWPAASSNVIAVGGTTLTFSGGTLTSETAWSGSGGGKSAYETEPSYQSLYGIPSAGGFRGVPDVSYNADPNSGVSVYDSTGGAWVVVGGTSAGAPQWAAIRALSTTVNNTALYEVASSGSYASDFRDVTSGTNGSCGTVCTAATGYDYVTGLGSPLTQTFTVPVTNVDVTEASGGADVSIDTTSHAGGTGVWTALTGPVITENDVNQIASGVHTFTLPSGWEFNTGHNVTVTVDGVSSLAVSSATITPGATSFSFTVSATSGGSAGSITLSGIQVRPTGTIAGTLGNLVHSGVAIAGVNGSTSFGSLSTAAGTATSVNVETTGSGSGVALPMQSLSSGGTLDAYSITRDQFGNFVANAPAVWSLTSKTGSVADGDLVASSDTESATFTWNLVGSAKVHAVVSGPTSVDSGTITVTQGTLAGITLSPSEATTTADATRTYTASGSDAAGNTSDVTGSTSFSISLSAGGSWSGAIYTPQHAGDWTVTGTDGSLTNTALLHTTAGNGTALAFTTEPTSTVAGGSISDVAVSVEDAHGNVLTSTTTSVTLAIGTNPSAGLLSGTLSHTAVAGVASFDSLSINNSGVGYTLSASAAGLTGTTSSAFTISPVVLPSVDVDAGTYTSDQSITLTAVGSESIRYTTDGTAPDCNTPVGTSGTSPIHLSISGSETVEARACYASAVQSAVTSFAYVLQCVVPTVEHGAVSDYPACSLTCNSGYHESAGSCVRNSSSGGGGGGGGGGASVPIITVPVTSPIDTIVTPFASTTAPIPTNSSGLSSVQVSAILGLLQSFGADASVIAQVTIALTGQGISLLPTASPSPFTRDLMIGMQGADVTALQNILIARHLGPAALTLSESGATGLFGPRTRTALVEFQRASGITPASGYFGPRTRALMGS